MRSRWLGARTIVAAKPVPGFSAQLSHHFLLNVFRGSCVDWVTLAWQCGSVGLTPTTLIRE
jgi:hypothetical protein